MLTFTLFRLIRPFRIVYLISGTTWTDVSGKFSRTVNGYHIRAHQYLDIGLIVSQLFVYTIVYRLTSTESTNYVNCRSTRSVIVWSLYPIDLYVGYHFVYHHRLSTSRSPSRRITLPGGHFVEKTALFIFTSKARSIVTWQPVVPKTQRSKKDGCLIPKMQQVGRDKTRFILIEQFNGQHLVSHDQLPSPWKNRSSG